MHWQLITEQIEAATGEPFKLIDVRAQAGGDINSAYCLQGPEQAYFVKLNRAGSEPMFAAEAAGLLEIAATQTLRVPAPIVHGTANAQAFLVLEYIRFDTNRQNAQALMGEQLAAMHAKPQPHFGWHRDNTIGSTEQPNNPHKDWVEFWRIQRLQHQLNLAAENGYRGKLQEQGELLCAKFAGFFDGYQPRPSLLHGDLWGGNAACDEQGNPVIFDPACYYGDREADLAMTELFGGFGPAFYAAYRQASPLDPGYSIRKRLYNLYHILNHLNLFGRGYLAQAVNMVDDLLSEVS
jgi:protein-ribulosamine 3-kinase